MEVSEDEGGESFAWAWAWDSDLFCVYELGSAVYYDLRAFKVLVSVYMSVKTALEGQGRVWRAVGRGRYLSM